MKIKLPYKILIYLLGLFLSIGYVYYKTDKLDITYLTLLSIVFVFIFLITEVYAPWAEKKDINNILELLSKKYNTIKKIDDNTLEIDFNQRTLRITSF